MPIFGNAASRHRNFTKFVALPILTYEINSENIRSTFQKTVCKFAVFKIKNAGNNM